MAEMDEVDRIIDAIGRDDPAAVDELLRTYPQHRFLYGGKERWLRSAVMNGRINVVKLLVSLGADPTAAENTTDSDPEPEGPIFHAVCANHFEMVRYLLDLGAPINHIVEGRLRCFSLGSAAMYGYIDMAKLLVERGAAVNAVWRGRSPLDDAFRLARKTWLHTSAPSAGRRRPNSRRAAMSYRRRR